MPRNEYQKLIAKTLSTRPIAFNPDLSRILSSVKAGLFLSQLLFWCGKGRDPKWIYKTVNEFKDETSLSKKEQSRAKKICVSKGVIEVKLKGTPAKRHFKINIDKIIELLKKSKSSHP